VDTGHIDIKYTTTSSRMMEDVETMA